MDDLAGLVVKQLRLDDGPGPFVQIFTSRDRKNALVATAERINGIVHYEYAYVDVTDAKSRMLHEGEERVAWSFVKYTDVDAAAYFGLAFMHRWGQEGCMTMHRRVNMDKIFDERAEHTLLPQYHTRDIGYGFNCFSERIGATTKLDTQAVRAGLLSLMPTSHNVY